jgi:hypothetical protein
MAYAGTNNDLLAMALVGYEAQKAKIIEAISAIQEHLGHRSPGPKVETDEVTPAKRALLHESALALHNGSDGPLSGRPAQPAKPKRAQRAGRSDHRLPANAGGCPQGGGEEDQDCAKTAVQKAAAAS